MKYYFSKISVLIIALVLIITNLVSCGSENVTPDTNNQASSKEILPGKDVNKQFENFTVTREYDFNIFEDEAEFSFESFYDEQSGKSMPYRLHLPKNIKKDKKYPVILFLHGAGEIGSDNSSHITNFSQGFTIASDLLSECIIVCPQTPMWWSLTDGDISGENNGYLGVAKRITDNAIKEYGGDTDRVYLTGLSMGSFATWDILNAYPDYFAAAVPVCGGGGSYASETMVNTPIWIFHGTADPTVSYEGSLATYNAIKDAGGENIKFTTLEGVEHNAWDYAYKDRAMFSWLFAQNRKNKAMADDYKGMLEIIAEDGETVINEKNTENLWGASTGTEEFIEIYFNDQADELLTEKCKSDQNQTFTLKIFGKPLYDFKFTKYPSGKMIKIAKTVNDETFLEIIKLLENTHRFNQEINGF